MRRNSLKDLLAMTQLCKVAKFGAARLFMKLKILVRRAREREVLGLSTNREGLRESPDDSEHNKLSKQ